MTWQSVGVLSPGEMGAAVAMVLRAHGLRVLTCLEGRSARTRQRADAAGLEVVPTLAALVSTVDTVFSIVPTFSAPAVGAGIAQAIEQTGKSIVFVEANAISPMTSSAIEQTITRSGARYIDGCIIGGPADVGRSTMFYLSGAEAEVAAAAMRAGGLCVEVLGERIGQASAFKMGYAGFTKGTTALLLELTLMAHKWGFLDAILAKYGSSHPEALRMFTTHLTTWPEYAAIRAEEMVEIAAMAAAAGLTPIMAPGAEQVIGALAKLTWNPTDASDRAALERQLPLQELIPLLAAKGMLKAIGEPGC
ncbi:MAG TPA: NAD(P)-binding domain-containing protein [Candidatus Tectomicrobia bacterium]|nr:NAD(P)-binding domain-containing protein [Candidatus Tectomicrobia bacterium]